MQHMRHAICIGWRAGASGNGRQESASVVVGTTKILVKYQFLCWYPADLLFHFNA